MLRAHCAELLRVIPLPLADGYWKLNDDGRVRYSVRVLDPWPEKSDTNFYRLTRNEPCYYKKKKLQTSDL